MYLIPAPKSIRYLEEIIPLDRHMRLVMSNQVPIGFQLQIKNLQETIRKEWGIEISIFRGKAKEGDLFFDIDVSMSSQSYEICINKEQKIIKAGDEEGLSYGIMTLGQIITQYVLELPALIIKDEPYYKQRGYYYDVTRSRIPSLSSLKKLVDRMARYKLNQLQLYVEHTYLFEGMSEMWRDQTPLTADEIMELDAYCHARHIDLVPSIATFGHLYMLLRTKSYGQLCELDEELTTPFSFYDRMHHHTVNVTDPRSLKLAKKMILEYMGLFSSKYFNICADETFDLGRGKSKEEASIKGLERLYIDYVKELCDFVIDQDRIPMFWGDIITSFPEYLSELPTETICLNWGYAANQSEAGTRLIAQAKARQYVCPGVAGWNQWINLMESSYENIRRMCEYGRKYGAIGVLNTDWGDYGHINHLEFSTVGMIYGASLSWQDGETLDKKDLDQAISILEYKEATGKWVETVSKLSDKSIFTWSQAVRYYEFAYLSYSEEERQSCLSESDFEEVEKANQEIQDICQDLHHLLLTMDQSIRYLMSPYEIAIEAMILWNCVGQRIYETYDKKLKDSESMKSDQKLNDSLAEKLETWFMDYKELWRSAGKEGELQRLSSVVFYYADLLRSIS